MRGRAQSSSTRCSGSRSAKPSSTGARSAAASATDRAEDVVLVGVHHGVIEHHAERLGKIGELVALRHLLEPFELVGLDLDLLDDLVLLHPPPFASLNRRADRPA